MANFCEYCSILLLGECGSVLVTVIYRSPNSDTANNNSLLTLMQEIGNAKAKFKIIVGDFNLPNITWENYTSKGGSQDFSSLFIEKIRDCFLVQTVHDVTRMRGGHASILDLLFTNDEEILEEVSIESPIGRSDHACIHACLNFEAQVYDRKKKRLMYERADYEAMKSRLNVDWNEVLGIETDTEGKWRRFVSLIRQVIDEYIPVQRIGRKSTWVWKNASMSGKLWKKIKKKHRLWNRMKEMKLEGNLPSSGNIETEYRRLNNQIRRDTRNAAKIREQEIARNVKRNPKVFWRYVSSKTKIKSTIGDLYIDGKREETATSNKEKSRILSEQFASVFVEEPVGEVPKAKKENVKIELDNFDITKEAIRKVLNVLKTDKSPGPDCIHPRVIKELREELLEPLCIIFTSSLREGKVPEEWKEANITAIFKKGDRKEAGNYRPVSLTSVVCKIMETLMRERIIHHMKQNNLFSRWQFGFISGRSTVLQLINVIESWTDAIDRGLAVDVVYLDFMKAFDRVPHRRLLEKMSAYNINGNVRNWIEDFLTGRRQRVLVSGEASEWRNVISGVPQGSVLGPLLFVIFINDLPDTVKNNSQVYLYADDTKVYKIVENVSDCLNLQEDLDEIKKWSEKWLLSFHPDKSKQLRIGNTSVVNKNYRMYENITRSRVEKDIGVIIDDQLTFSEHLAEKINRANRIVGLIRRV